jgi:diacylglycerol kinase family enzyme
MNVARTLWVPRDLAGAARTIAEGKVLAMDMRRVGDRFFLVAAGAGLDAGLFGYFERLEGGGNALSTLRAGVRFLRQLGSPRITLKHEFNAWCITGENREAGAALFRQPVSAALDGVVWSDRIRH